MAQEKLARSLMVARELAERAALGSFEGFLDQVVIDSRPEPRKFSEVADPWQYVQARRYSEALENITGHKPGYRGPRSYWQGMPRGHDKTSAIARAALWMLASSRRKLSGVVAAADGDQAKLIVEAMTAINDLNWWLKERVTVGANKAQGPGGSLKIVTSDAPSAFGATNDFFILDELTHWKKRDLWDAIWSGRVKRPEAVALIITNAGTLRSWQDDVRQAAKQSSDWDVFEVPEGQKWSSWMKQKDWDGLRAFLTPQMAKRVLDNVWVDPSEDNGWLTRTDIQACWDPTIPLFSPKKRSGFTYKASVDYGAVKDRCALCVLHAEPGPDIIPIDRLDVWQGSHENRVKIKAVEEWLDEMIELFNCDLVFDPYQMEGTIQKYEGRRSVTRFEGRGGKSNYELAECLRHLVANRKLRFNPSLGTLTTGRGVETFTDELASLVIQATQYGYRVQHHKYKADQPPEFVCHDDRTVAVGMAALEAVRDFTGGPWLAPVSVVRGPEDGGLEVPKKPEQHEVLELLRKFNPKSILPSRNLYGVGRVERK